MFNIKAKNWTAEAATVFLIFFLMKFSFVNGTTDNNVINLLNSLTDNEAEPTTVFIKSCWPVFVKAEFMKKVTVQAIFIDDFLYELPVDLNPNTVMFITNLDCNWAEDFVNGVRDLRFL